MKKLTEVEQDYSYSLGFLEQWLKDAPKQVLEQLAVLASGIKAYREKYVSIQEDHDNLLARYNTLTAQSAQYLQFIQNQKELLDQALIDSQREFHQKDRTEIDTGVVL